VDIFEELEVRPGRGGRKGNGGLRGRTLKKDQCPSRKGWLEVLHESRFRSLKIQKRKRKSRVSGGWEVEKTTREARRCSRCRELCLNQKLNMCLETDGRQEPTELSQNHFKTVRKKDGCEVAGARKVLLRGVCS